MAEQIAAVIERVIDPATRPTPERQPSLVFWKDLNEDLKDAKTPEEKEAVWKRYADEKSNIKPNRRQRRGSTLDPVKFRPLTREQRARLIFLAEQMDANTKERSKHGGCLKRTGLQVLRVLLFHYHNVHTGRCDPSYEAIAKAAGMSRSAVAEALNRLEAAGIITRIRRARWDRRNGRKCCVQWSNAYLLDLPKGYRKTEISWYEASKSGKRTGTTAAPKKKEVGNLRDIDPELQRALARLGNVIADREEGLRTPG
jgi:DNA-binding Lrp family transcriptional regulator